jgi:hypothetical protein
MVTHEIWVAGRPATFATKGEKPWKEVLAAVVPPPGTSDTARGVRLEFVLPTLTPSGMPLDVDNLCEPVFSAVVNGLGWFGGQRNRIEWWEASKREARRGEEAGCWIRFDNAAEPGDPESAGLIDAGYCGPLPRSAKDEAVHGWAWDQRKAVHPGTVPKRAALWLDFGDGTVNLGDIATGRVKNFIDCLYPIIGGAAGSPDDHRFERIVVTRSADRAVSADVRVRIEATGFVDSGLGPRPGSSGAGRPAEPARKRNEVEQKSRPGSRPASNPCMYGTCKWLVVQAAIEGWSRDRLLSELQAHPRGKGANMQQYITDVRTENHLALVWRDGQLVLAN